MKSEGFFCKTLKLLYIKYDKNYISSSKKNIYFVINMNKKSFLLGILCTLMLASSIASGTSLTQTYTYGVEVGNESIFNVYFNLYAEFESSFEYDVSDMAGLVEDYFAPINEEEFQIQMEVTQIYSDSEEYDVFNASIRAREAEDEEGEWGLPTAYSTSEIYDVANYTLNSLGDVNDMFFQSGVNNATKIIDETIDFDNGEIQRINTVNSTSSDADEPQSPFDIFGLDGPVFFKPTEYDLGEWLTYAEDVANYNIDSTPYEDFDQMVESAGISTLKANPNGMAIVFDTTKINSTFYNTSIDYTFIEDFTGVNFDPNDTVTDVPLSDFEVLMHMAIEYDEDGILADYIIYYDFSAVVDTTGFADSPLLVDERFHVYLTVSIYNDEWSTAEKDQIIYGEVGDNRNLSGFNCPFLNSIPGYPIGAMSALGLISVAVLVLKFKRKNSTKI